MLFSVYSQEKRNILIIHSHHNGKKWSEQINRGIIEELSEKKEIFEVHYEYLDTLRAPLRRTRNAYQTLFFEKYSRMEFDLIITVDFEAFNFINAEIEKLFNDVPIIFCGINNYAETLPKPFKNGTGVTSDIDVEGTIDLIVEIHPEVEKIYVISDDSIISDAVYSRLDFYREIKNNRPEFVDLKNKHLSEITEYLEKMDEKTVALYVSYYNDPDGNFYQTEEIIEIIDKFASRPVYSFIDYNIELGLTGGKVVNGYYHGKKVGEIARKILSGIKIDTIPIITDMPSTPTFQYEKLQKFGISKNKLPKNSIIIDEPVSVFYVYRKEIISNFVFMAFQMIIIAGLLINIIKRRKAEKLITEFNMSLEERVKERTYQLQAINKELEAFAHTVSHDLRSPLGLIIGYGNLLIEEFEKTNNEKNKKYISNIVNAADRMNELIRDLIKLSQINRDDLNFSEFDFSNMVEVVFEDSRKLYAEKNIKFLNQKEVLIWADYDLMLIVVENLINNSLKYSSKKEEVVIEFGTKQDSNGKTIYFIKDNGVGFNNEDASKIFDTFTRLPNSKGFKGTGIGLATVKRIISRHNGKIWAEGKIDEGATVYFTL